MSKISLVGILLGLFLVAPSCYARSAPKFDQTVPVEGLKESVSVQRDARSIPYIEAKSESDLYFAQGFETARDRLWQMDLYRRVARGRLAELFGKQVLKEDKRWRRFGFSGVAEEALRIMNPDLRSALENYARGVNAYIATLDKKTIPVEFQILQYEPEPWKPTDTVVIGKILADGLSTTWWQDLNRVGLQKLPTEKYNQLTRKITPSDVVLFGTDGSKSRSEKANVPGAMLDAGADLEEFVAQARKIRKDSLARIGFYAERLAASNNWVISGKKTADGNAILANDPHLPGTAPGIWYLAHLATPDMRVSGVTFPGVPGIVLGHNQFIAWGATNVGPDVQDLYIEVFNSKGQYKTPNGWKTAVTRKEEIKFRPNLLSPKTESETLEVVETQNGVVFREQDGKKLSLRWTAMVPANQEFEAFFLLNRARNWAEFKSAIKTFGGASQNFVYADVKGNIGWHVGGRIPIRRKGEGAVPYDGSTGDGDWIGYIPFENMPNLYNPESGFIVTANQRIVGTDYRYQQVTRQFASPWRARRLYNLIETNNRITMADVQEFQYDSYNIPLKKFAAEIVKRQAASKETLKLLREWDGRMTSDSVAATVANAVNNCVAGEIASLNKPARSWKIRGMILPWAIPNDEKLWLPRKYSSWNEFLVSCEKRSLERLGKIKRLGSDMSNWKWGTYRSANFRHPLAIAPLIGGQFKAQFSNVSGNGETPNVGPNVSMRFVAKPANWDETRHVIPLGQSGDPKSPFWKDQFDAWQSGNSPVFPFTRGAVALTAVKSTLLTPSNVAK